MKRAEAAELKKMLDTGRQKARSMPEHQLLKLTDLRAELHNN